jgi:hypothetical protein
MKNANEQHRRIVSPEVESRTVPLSDSKLNEMFEEMLVRIYHFSI